MWVDPSPREKSSLTIFRARRPEETSSITTASGDGRRSNKAHTRCDSTRCSGNSVRFANAPVGNPSASLSIKYKRTGSSPGAAIGQLISAVAVVYQLKTRLEQGAAYEYISTDGHREARKINGFAFNHAPLFGLSFIGWNVGSLINSSEHEIYINCTCQWDGRSSYMGSGHPEVLQVRLVRIVDKQRADQTRSVHVGCGRSCTGDIQQ